MQNGTAASSEIKHILGLDQQASGRERLKLIAPTVLALALIGVGAAYILSSKGNAIQFKIAAVKRGDLTVTVTATGTLEPVNQVEVGSELSGTVEAVAVDYNEQVERGQILARLDTEELEARVVQGRAALKAAAAKVEEAQATILETRLRHERCQMLMQKQLCTQEDVDSAQAAYARAQAAQASARAQVEVAQATLAADEAKLKKAAILAPIVGIVLQRRVEPGQTVAASMQTPVLFTLAEDLTKMELQVDVDEADVGKIKIGQQASFTVAAYPDRRFQAKITQIRYAPETVQGVVTYKTLLVVDNAELLLRPGMTATADIIVQQIKGALLVPNAALRFTPPSTDTEAKTGGGGLLNSLLPRPPAPARSNQGAKLSAGNGGQRVWSVRDGEPYAIAVTVGASDGTMTEVRAGELAEGKAVVVDAVGTDS